MAKLDSSSQGQEACAEGGAPTAHLMFRQAYSSNAREKLQELEK